MTRKASHRVMLDPFEWIRKRMPLADDQQRDIGIAYHISLQALLSGAGDEQAWSTLACSINTSLLLCERGYYATAIETIKLAQTALMSCKIRAEKLGKWGFNGTEARLIMAACNIHDEQLGQCTRDDITSALQEVHRRIEVGEVFS